MLKNQILTYLIQRQDQLSYFQFSRKLANDNFHEYLEKLSETIFELEKEGLIDKKELENGVAMYAITDLGKKYMDSYL
jgi:hypothetical protein